MDNLTLGVIGAVIVIGLLTIFKFSGKKEKEENKDRNKNLLQIQLGR